MRANLYATFRLLAGTKSLALDLPGGATIRQVIDAVVEQRPVLRANWLNEAGELNTHVHIFVNGRDSQYLTQGIDTPLEADAVLDFFPPVGGGAEIKPC